MEYERGVEFTFNTGIFTDKLFGPFYKEVPPKFPTEVNSVLRFRISELKDDPDIWYKIDLSSDLDEVKREVDVWIANNCIDNIIYLPEYISLIIKKRSVVIMKNMIIGIIVLFALFVVLSFFNINIPYLFPNVIEWATKFLLPWIFLYWFIRLVKSFEHK